MRQNVRIQTSQQRGDAPPDRRLKITLVYASGQNEIWEVRESYGSDFYAYSGGKLVRVCPSIGGAREVLA